MFNRGPACAGALMMLAGCATPRPGLSSPTVVAPPTADAAPPAGMQYLYGSGEAVALSRQVYNVLIDHVRRRLESERAHPELARVSVVLAADATIDQPRTLPCKPAMPRAAVFDMDETVLLNTGYEYAEAIAGGGFDAASWARWERDGAGKASAVPGAIWAFIELRRMGVTVIVNTNRSAASAAAATELLKEVELGEFRHGETLFLKGDVDGKSGKDGRRAAIAATYCVIAMAGDQLGDFTDKFIGTPMARRDMAEARAVWRLWGRGWFALPNPVYGSGVAGDWDQVFPRARRWADPQAKGAK